MDSVTNAPGMARFRELAYFVFFIVFISGCAPVPGDSPDTSGPPQDSAPAPVPAPEPNPSQPEPPAPQPEPIPPADPAKPLLPALWEKPHASEGPKWSEHAYSVVSRFGSSLLKGTQDVGNFCPRYKELSGPQKITFWVYLFSAMAKYESGFDPTNRFKETGLGTDPVTKQPVYSEGLLQLSYQDSLNYSFCNEFDWSIDRHLHPDDPRKTILDPYKNLSCGIRILNQLVGKKHLISFGSGHYWSVLKTDSKYNKISSIQGLTKQIPFCN